MVFIPPRQGLGGNGEMEGEDEQREIEDEKGEKDGDVKKQE